MTDYISGANPRLLVPVLVVSRCRDARACELACPEIAIGVDDLADGSRVWSLIVARCTGCGLCISACPERAISARPPRPVETLESWVHLQ